MIHKLLVGFRKIRRPASWVQFAIGIVGMFVTFFNIILTGQAKWATMAVFFLIACDGFGEVKEAEDDVNSPASKGGK